MMLIALYKHPADPADFDQRYFGTHVPLISKVPGLNRLVVTRFSRRIMGDDLYMMAEMFFDDEASLKAAMKSDEMRAAGDNLNSFAGDLVTLLFGQSVSELAVM